MHRNTGAKLSILKTAEPKTTQLAEIDGRLFHLFWGVLCGNARELMEEREKDVFDWNAHEFTQNSMEARLYVSDYLLSFYAQVLELVKKKNRRPNGCPLLSTISANLIGRPLKIFTAEHMEILASWETIRVEGEFWYLGITTEGALFAQLGDTEDDENIFVVKALSSTFTQLFAGRPGDGDGPLPGTVVETVLLPYKGGITYFCSLAESRMVPKKHEALYARLENIIDRCTARGTVFRTLDASLTKFFQRNAASMGLVSE